MYSMCNMRTQQQTYRSNGNANAAAADDDAMQQIELARLSSRVPLPRTALCTSISRSNNKSD
jgi:hypothetical protein